jgi:mRNA-degrading endonuclease RelE of RelBE toxin-antitoxin system
MTYRETRKVNYGDYVVYCQVNDASRRVELVDFQHGAKREEA